MLVLREPRWNGDPWSARTTLIAVGRQDGIWCACRCIASPDGRAPLKVSAKRGPHAEHYARATARRWMRTIGGTWA